MLHANWRPDGNDALERVGVLERKIKDLSALSAARPVIDRGRLLQLAQDLPTVWNAPSTETRTKQRLIHILVQEIICDLDDATNEAVLLIHWTGGRHTRCVWRASRPEDILPSSAFGRRGTAQIGRTLPDRELAVSLNRMLARQVMARAGRPCVFVTCASAWEFPHYDATKVDYR